MLAYVASSLDNRENVAKVIKVLEQHDIQITYKWHEHGRVDDISTLPDIAMKEFNGVKNADFLVFLMPARMGSHIEFGIALAFNKPIYIITEDLSFEEKSFYHLPQIGRYNNVHQLLEKIVK